MEEESYKQNYLEALSAFATMDEVRALISSSLTNLNQPVRVQSQQIESAGFTEADGETAGNGWRIDAQGNCYFNDGHFRGDITGATGTFSGTVNVGSLNIPDSTTANSFHTDALGNSWWGCNVADFTADNDNAKAYILKTGAAKFETIFSVGGGGKLLEWDNTDITLLGGIITGGTLQTATSGQRIVITSTGMTLYDTSGVIGYLNNTAVSNPLNLDATVSGGGIALFRNQSTNSGSWCVAIDNYGANYALDVVAQNNALRTRAAMRIAGVSGQGAHMQLEPKADFPQAPSEGDVFAKTDHRLYYHNGQGLQGLAMLKKVVGFRPVSVDTGASSPNYVSVQTVSASVRYAVWTDTSDTDVNFSKSTDGGVTWSAEAKIDDGVIGYSQNALYAADANNLFVVYKEQTTGDFYLAKSTNAGASWTPSAIDTTMDATKHAGAIGGTSATNLFAVWYHINIANPAAADDQIIYFSKSTDGGANWSAPVTLWSIDNAAGSVASALAIAVIDDNNIWVAAVTGKEASPTQRVFKTSDGGTNWTTLADLSNTLEYSVSISAVSATEVYVTTFPGGSVDLFKSTGGDFTTKIDLTSLTQQRVAVYAPLANNIYVVGFDNGDDFRLENSIDGGTTFTGKVIEANAATLGGIAMHGIDNTEITIAGAKIDATDIRIFSGIGVMVYELDNNAVAPLLPPKSGGVYIYAKNGELYGQDSAGNESAALT